MTRLADVFAASLLDDRLVRIAKLSSGASGGRALLGMSTRAIGSAMSRDERHSGESAAPPDWLQSVCRRARACVCGSMRILWLSNCGARRPTHTGERSACAAMMRRSSRRLASRLEDVCAFLPKRLLTPRCMHFYEDLPK